MLDRMGIQLAVRSLLALMMFAFAAVQPALAGTITVGTSTFLGTGGENGFPFSPGAYAAGGEYQEIYSSLAFGGPVSLTSIAFASTLLVPSPAIINYDVTLGLSNTSASTTAPSTNFATNKGSNFSTVFSGKLVANLQNNKTFDLVFPIAPFFYDPIQGNLLLDIVMNAKTVATLGDALFLINDLTTPPVTARVFQSFGTGPAFTDSLSLFTQFGTAEPGPAVPEPSTWLLLGSGLIGLVLWRRRQVASCK
jgi:hypothetical protein